MFLMISLHHTFWRNRFIVIFKTKRAMNRHPTYQSYFVKNVLKNRKNQFSAPHF